MPKKLLFDVVHVSGNDEGYSGKELEVHSPTTRGWQSLRFCEYPQEIIFSLKKECKITKIQVLSHQHNIASKIEVYIGRCKIPGVVSLRDCQFTRLGYVFLSTNENANYLARELKSIALNKDGVFVKMLVHKNHVNKLNIYNQVCIVGVNILGYSLSEDFNSQNHHNERSDDVVNYYMNQTQADSTIDASQLASNRFENGKYVSPYDDLSFDMYQDPETAQLIRKLDERKHDAIIEERYDYAKKLKEAIADLQKVGQKLGKFEVEKRRAVEMEDFDTAKKKKLQSDEYRVHVYRQLDIHDLLQIPKISIRSSSLITDTSAQVPKEIRRSPSPNVKQNTELKLPPVESATSKSKIVEEKISIVEPMPEIHSNMEYQQNKSQNEMVTKNDDRPLPALSKKSHGLLDDQEDLTEHETDLPTLSEKEEREAELIIDIFGMNMAQHLYSKSWKHRQDTLIELKNELQNPTALTNEHSSKSVSRAIVSVLKKSLNDQVYVVLNESTGLLKSLLQSYISQKSLGKSEVAFILDKVIPVLMKRLGDTAPRTRSIASDLIIDIANFPEVKGSVSIPNLVTEPFKAKKQAPWRLLKSQIDLLQKLIGDIGLDLPGGLSTESVMKVLLSGLEHPNNDVREASISCIVEAYKIVKEPLKSYLPPDDTTSRKNPLYVKLFDSLDRADGKMTEAERKAAAKKQKEDAEKSKKNEVKALKAQLDEMRNMAKAQLQQQSVDTLVENKENENNNNNNTIQRENKDEDNKKPINTNTKNSKKKSITTFASRTSLRPISQRNKEDGDLSEKMCIFCGEKNEKFTDEGLDIHYWKGCPMLQRCDGCSQVVEISSLSDHLLNECDVKTNYSQCNKCGIAVLKTEFQQHKRSPTCKAPVNSSKMTCPLCFMHVLDTEEHWKSHLVEKCRVNLQRLRKTGVRKPADTSNSTNKTPGKRSQIPTNRGRGAGKTPVKRR